MDEEYTGLILADGTQMKDSNCGYSDRNLWCWSRGIGMADGFRIFGDASKTREITMQYYSKKIIYKGFTEMMVLRRGTDEAGNETIDACLTWPEGGEHSIEEIEISKE